MSNIGSTDSSPRQPNLVDHLTNRLLQAANRLQLLQSEVRSNLDRMMGSRPSPPNAAPPGGTLTGSGTPPMTRALEQLETAIEELEAEFRRINQ